MPRREPASAADASPESRTVKLCLRRKAHESLCLTLGRADVSLQDTDQADDFLYGQLMGYVMIHSPHLKITFKIHYSQKLATQITAARLGLDPRTLANAAADDFMREYCNMAGGYMADWLNRHHIPAVISIPLITDGFDEVWFSDRIHPMESRDYWLLRWPEGSITCSASFVVHDESILAGLQAPPAAATTSRGGITFL